MRTIVDKPGTLYLGKQGENLVRELAFREPACWAGEFDGQGTVQLLVKPPCGKAYPVIPEREDGLFLWRVTAADTAQAGYGSCELLWTAEDRTAKSISFATFVAKSASGGCGGGTCGPPDEPDAPDDGWPAYLEQVAQAGAEALDAAARAERAALYPPMIFDGTWHVWDQARDGYVSTGVPASGGEGASYRFGHGLKVDTGVVSVDTANGFEGDKTRPITAAAVETTVGNIEILLAMI